jgi:hypothetical protein
MASRARPVRLRSRLPLRQSLGRLLFLAWVGLVIAPMAALASVPTPTVSLPPAGGKGFPFDTSPINLASFGYTESEFFISGNAQAFVNSGTLGNNGVWNVSPGATAPYLTRMLVRAPAESERFNGTVVVEWINVSGGVDATPEWDYAHVELLREGYVWVGVSAQFVGTEFLKTFDSVRYASISHPGDSWSYDIYSQAGMAVLHGNPQPLGALTPLVRTMLAAGESQSAFRMFTYYNAIHPLAGIYQGFLIHSTGSGAALSQSFAGGGIGPSPIPAPPGVPKTPDIPVPATAFIRSDLRQPVLFLNSETDVTVLGAGFSVHNQPDSHTFRMWEITGTTHADAYLLEFAGADAAKSGLAVPPFNCGNPPINVGPHTFAVREAVHALNLWTREPERRPSIGPRFTVQIVTSPRAAAVLVRDPMTGNAVGGIRLPELAVPIETLTGVRPPAAVAGNPNCALFGATDPWDGDSDPWDGQPGLDPSPTPEPSLAALYGTRHRYLEQYEEATEDSIEQGFLLRRDRDEVINLSEVAVVPKGAAINAEIVPDP